MRDEIVLKIVLEGSGPGLEAGRLSLSAFHNAFRDLLRAYRGIATSIILAADSDDVNVRAQGRKPRLAEHMDLEIDSITHQSPSAIRLVCAVPEVRSNQTNELFATDVVRRTARELLESVDAEAVGRPRNKYIRRYLAALPSGTTRQVYEVYEGGMLVRALSVTSVNLPSPTLVGAGIVRFDGRVVGVHFPPDAGEVRILVGDDIIALKASDKLVEQAIALRNVPVSGVGTNKGGKFTLLWIRQTDTGERLPKEARNRLYGDRWAGVLKLLAK